MSEPQPPITPRARPVADLPLDALVARDEELARRWAMTLLIGRPLNRMSEVPLEQLAWEGPELCAQAIRALASDLELDRLTGAVAPSGRGASAPARRLAAIAGVHEVGEVVVAIEALRRVLWETLLEELLPGQLGWASPILDSSPVRQLADLADRLACVCASLVAVAVVSVSTERDAVAGSDAAILSARENAPRDRDRAARERDRVLDSGGEAVIVDERSRAPVSEGQVAFARPRTAPEGALADERPLSWDESPPLPPRARAGEIEIRDERREQGAAAWTRSIGRQLERFERDGLPFAALLVELVDVERMSRHEPGTLTLVAATIEQALVGELQAQPGPVGAGSGAVTQERPGRYWVLVPETDRLATERLAERLARAAHVAMRRRGSSLEVAIGTAVCPDDGREAAALAAHADVGLYAARSAARAAAGRPAASVDEPV
ncbi:MAG TPA: hypothetical protein VK252_00660 [Solirubrobacteraceae bacterium]|nr:hypothetical protein [Solirubrobacteraceae bacterium]